MKVVFFQRKSYQDNHSIEKVFDTLRTYLPTDIEKEIFIPKYYSKGLWRRIYSIFEAYHHQGDINHITGDIHFVSFLMRKHRTILTIHSGEGTIPAMTPFQRFWFRLLWYILPIQRTKKVVTVSHYLKQEIVNYTKCDPAIIQVIPNPVFQVFQYVPKVFDTQKPKILQIGTKDNKNILRLVEALKNIPCQLTIVGKPQLKQIEVLKKNKIDYQIVGPFTKEEMFEAYKSCDIVTFISTYEGFGMPIIEANAVGRVVIAGSVASMPEVGGDAALFVNPLDIEAIRRGILKIINNQKFRNHLIECGLENVKRFSPQYVADQYYKLYKEMLNEV